MSKKSIKYNEMSNSELKIKMKEMENEYEALKNKINESILRMDELDKKYNEIKNVFNKRAKGIII